MAERPTTAKPKADAKPAASEWVNPFRTCDAAGKPVMFRFSSAKSLRDAFIKAQRDDDLTASGRSKIQGMFYSKLPWDPAKLEALGFRDKANFNSNELRSLIEARSGAVFNIALDTTDVVTLMPAAAELAGPDADQISAVISDEFSKTLREDPGMIPALATMTQQCDLTGLGPMTWPDPVSWRPVALQRGQLKLFENSPVLSSANEILMYEGTLPAAYVFSLFDNPEMSESAGWYPKNLKRFAVETFADAQDASSQYGSDYGTSVVEAAVVRMRENRVFETRQFETMKVIHAFVREVSGDRKVSHYIIPAREGFDEFLMVRYGIYDGMDQCLVWLPYSVTEPSAAAVRGLASYVAPIIENRNRKLCEFADAADMLTKIHLSRTQAGSRERMTIEVQGQYRILPADLKAEQAPMSAQNVKQAAELMEMVSRTTVQNALGAVSPAALADGVYEGGDRRTKEEVLLSKEAVDKAAQALFVTRMLVFDTILRESFRRFMALATGSNKSWASDYPEVGKFIRRCAKRSVTREILKRAVDEFDVVLCRDIVSGGAGVKAGLLADVLGVWGGNLDEQGRNYGTRELVRCRLGTSMADRLRPLIGRDQMPSDAASHAQLENNDMLELTQALAAQDQLHWSHIPVHGKLLELINQAVQNGQVTDPQRMLDTLQLVSEHIQAHIQYGGVQLGMQEAAKAAMANIRSMRPIQQELTIMAANADRVKRAEEEKQQREMDDLQGRAEGKDNAVKIHEIDTKAALKVREQDLMHEARMSQADSKAQTDMFRARARAEIDRITQQSRRIMEASKITGNPPPSTEALAPPPTF